MGFINKYPYTDFHELNLDWFLEEFKKVTDKVTDLDTTVQQFTEFVTNYFDNLDVQQEINNKLNEMMLSGELGEIVTAYFEGLSSGINARLAIDEQRIEVVEQRSATNTNDVSALSARMDSFASLAEGSTTGDAELIDARVGANGVTYASAGDAIRAQFGLALAGSDIVNQANIDDVNDVNFWETGGLSTATGANATNAMRKRTVKYLPTNLDYFDTRTANESGLRFYLLAYTLDGSYVGAYKTSGRDDHTNGTFVTDGSESPYLYLHVGAVMSAYPNYRFRMTLFAAGVTVTNTHIADCVASNVDEGYKRVNTMKVMTYNIGKYNYGHAGGLSTDVDEKILNYKRLFGRVNPDFLMLQEQVQYIDSNNIYDSDATLYDPFFKYESHYEGETCTKGQYELLDSYHTYLHTSGDNPARAIVSFTTWNKKLICVVSAVLNSSAPVGVDHQAQQLRALQKLTQQICINYDYVVVGLDTNVLNVTEEIACRSFMQGEGYTCANWGYFGDFDTYTGNMYKPIDNVFVKGGQIVNAGIAGTYDELSSDHLPFMAEIRF